MKTRSKVLIGVGVLGLIGGGLYLKSLGTKVVVNTREYRIKRTADSLLITDAAGDTVGVVGGEIIQAPVDPNSFAQMTSDIMTNPAAFGLTLSDLSLLGIAPTAVAGHLYAR